MQLMLAYILYKVHTPGDLKLMDQLANKESHKLMKEKIAIPYAQVIFIFRLFSLANSLFTGYAIHRTALLWDAHGLHCPQGARAEYSEST